MAEIDIGVNIDVDKLIETRLLIQANSGGGKSYAIRKLLEESNDEVQQVVLDIEGEFSTLRERYDYVLIGGDGDIPISLKIAAILPKKIMQLGASFIIDMSELKKHERILFVKRFLNALMDMPKKYWKALLVVVDECHIFCPEKGKAESAASVIDLMTRGRKRGYAGILATQRLSKLSKDAAAEANNKLIGRTGLDVDMKRAGEELGFSSKADTLSLRSMAPGEFYAFGPAISNYVTKIKVGSVKTKHPEPGQRMIEKSAPRSKIQSVLQKLQDLPEQAYKELKTEVDMKKEIKDLRTKLTIMEHKQEKQVIDPEALNKAKEQGFKEGERHSEIFWKKELKIAINEIDQHSKVITKIRKVLEDFQPEPIEITEPEIRKPITKFGQGKIKDIVIQPNNIDNEGNGNNNLNKLQRKILESLAKLFIMGKKDVPRPMLGAFCESKFKGGYFTNSLGGLRTIGYVVYGSPGNVSITEAGLEYIGVPATPASTEELQNNWKSIMNALQRKIFEHLVSIYPNETSREKLGMAVDTAHKGGYFTNSIGGLRTMGAIEYTRPGMVRASDDVFLEE